MIRTAIVLLLLSSPALALDGWKAADGDTIRSPQGERIRLLGVDTPERECRCDRECTMAAAATAFTRGRLKEAKRIDLIRFKPDRYGRTLARVYLDGADLSDMLILAGLGRPYSGGRRTSWCQ